MKQTHPQTGVGRDTHTEDIPTQDVPTQDIPTKNLKEKLLAALEPPTDSHTNTLNTENTKTFTEPCALTTAQACTLCAGKGYSLQAHKAHIQANLCSCLKSCTTCQGMSYRNHPSSGRIQPCKTPLPQRVMALYNAATLPVRFLTSKLETFRNFTGNGDFIMKQLKSYMDSYTTTTQQRDITHNKGLILSGSVGVGKTFLLVSLAKKLLEMGYFVKFVDFFQLISEIKAGFAQKSSEDLILKPLIDVDILLIDELGKGRNSEFEHTILDQIVMGRYNQGKPLICTTNYGLNQNSATRNSQHITDLREVPKHNFNLEHFGSLSGRVGGRIYSRLQESCVFMELTGSDYRTIRHANSPYHTHSKYS